MSDPREYTETEEALAELLADHPIDHILLEADAFDALVELLDAPPRDCPELAALMARPTVFDQDA